MSGEKEDLLPFPLPTPLRRVLAAGYGAVVAHRNRRFDRGLGVRRLNCPVVSVGNLSVGGTGKTPVVAWTAKTLASAGWRPVIALRGYRPDASGKSDEAMLHREAMPGVPIAVGGDRFAAIGAMGEPRGPRTVVVLDDGFQHRRLHRDFDLVLVDASQSDVAGHLIPHGRLREPPTSLARADAVMVTRANGVDEVLSHEIARWCGRSPMAWSRHAWASLSLHRDGRVERLAPSWLEGRRVATLLGVGHPESIRRQLAESGGREALRLPARDHDRYDDERVERLVARCREADSIEAVFTTAKDWVKLKSRWPKDLSVVVPDLAIDFLAGESELASALLGALPHR